MSVLDKAMEDILPKLVTFDPCTKDHLDAYYTLKYEGKQSKKYRFNLEMPFVDILHMMEHKICANVIRTEFPNRNLEYYNASKSSKRPASSSDA